jgi:FkbM family methyltransferase
LVVSFEPHPDSFEVLDKNVEYNEVNAELFDVALSNENGQVTLQHSPPTGHQLSNDDAGENTIVEQKRGDDLISNEGIPQPDICKIDIEGGEYLALKGLRETLRSSSCRFRYCEVHPEKIGDIGGQPAEVESLIANLGFSVVCLSSRDENYFIKTIR